MSFPPIVDVASGDFGREDWADGVKAGLVGCALAVFPLGGSREVGVPGTSQVLAYDHRPFRTLDAVYTDDFTWTLSVWMKVESGGSINAQVKDDLGSSVHTFSAETGTTWNEQRFEFTPNPARTYYLYFTKANDTAPGYGHGDVIRSADTL